MPTTAGRHLAVCLDLTRAMSRCGTLDAIYETAIQALRDGLGIDRASVLLFDADGVMRFKAHRGLSDGYRAAVEGHTPWRPDTPEPDPIVVPDVHLDPALADYRAVFAAEGIAALAFVPLTSLDRVIGKFMVYYPVPTTPSDDDVRLAGVIAAQVAFAIDRTRAETRARTSAERLRFALDAAAMGTWDWDLTTNAVVWSDNLAAIHGLPDGTFDGTFASYEREIHPEDRPRVFASIQRALAEGVPHDVEYRIVAPDGTVRWCEGKGRVELDGGRPIRMTGVCMMVTRRKEAELARLAAAEETSRLKDEFLATLSHELRTPLNAIVGWTQMLQRGQLGPADVGRAIDVIGRNARLQTRLIDDILDVSRIITGKLEIDAEPVAVAPILDAVVAGIALTAKAKDVRLECDVAGDVPLVRGDHKRLHQVFSNVLENAVKFTPGGGTVTVLAAREPDGVVVTVRDTGVGITPEFLPHVFDRFRQGDSRSNRAYAGLGLGLAITHHLVQQHGGRIDAWSEGAGRGTTITVRLPVAASGSPEMEADATQDDDVRLAGLTVLVVDDEPDAREMLAMLLERRGARVVPCDGADAALDALTRETVGVVIADIGMPGVDGYEFMRLLRRRGVATPAVALTAFAQHADRQRSLECGYTAYLAKPVDVDGLVRTLRQLVAREPEASGAASPAPPLGARVQRPADRPGG
jgi:PAS domain S-box-containing protein